MTEDQRPSPLPRDFVWGVSTSSYQIEGAHDADGKGLGIWDLHCRQRGRIANEDTGDIACDHYHRYAEDVALMARLGVGAYRFSVSWPRVLPRGRGAPNPAGLDFYDRLIDALLAEGIEPWLCLYHWDLPQAIENHGGWLNRDSVGWFADYAALIARRVGDRVKRFATFNEPSVFTLFSYGFGWNAPAIADRAALFRVAHHVNLAHGAAIDVLRSLVPGASLGAIHNRQQVLPCTKSEDDVRAAADLDAIWNLLFPEPQTFAAYPERVMADIEPHLVAGDMARIARPVDWFGVNHYSPIFAKAEAGPLGFGWGPTPDDVPRSDIGWPIFPDAFRDELIAVSRRYRLPVYVTENGSGGADAPDETGAVADPTRVAFLTQYGAALDQAVAQGADVRGYFIWSLLDNFEWGAGYANRFGLVHVDFKTQKRTPKSSFDWYAARIRAARGA